MTDSVESFSAMLRKVLGNRISPDAGTFLEMLADDAVMEFPYAPPGLPTRLDGKAAIGRHLRGLGDMIAFDRMGEPTILATTDPNVVVVEFEGFRTRCLDRRTLRSAVRIRDSYRRWADRPLS